MLINSSFGLSSLFLCLRFKLFDDPSALPMRRATNLAKMLADLLHNNWITLAVIKVQPSPPANPLPPPLESAPPHAPSTRPSSVQH